MDSKKKGEVDRHQKKLNILADSSRFAKAWGSELGKELLSLLVSEGERKRLLIATLREGVDNARDEVIAYSVILKLTEQIAARINNYNTLKEKTVK